MDDPLIVGVRLALYAVLLPLFGLPMFRLTTPQSPLPRRTLGAAAGLGILLSALGLAATVAAMAGTPVTATDPSLLTTFITQSALGWAWVARIAVLATITLLIARLPTPAIAALTATAVATLAWGGHGAAGEGATGWLRLIADIVHLLAAGAWIGALVALVAMLWSRRSLGAAHGALAGFASTGSIVVALILVTGVVNGIILMGWQNVGAALASTYGQLLALKIALFVAMLGLAALNRFVLTPAFERGAAPSALRTSLAVETGAAVAILALIAWLGTLEPPGLG